MSPLSRCRTSAAPRSSGLSWEFSSPPRRVLDGPLRPVLVQGRSKYPDQEIKPPLAPVLEEEQRPVGGPALGLQLAPASEARCWLIDASATQLVQIQRDRFIRNWRRVRADDRYPRYETLKPLFSEDWGQFVDFRGQEGFGVPEINQCEVTYINHIEVGAAGETFGQVDKVVSLVTIRAQRF